MALPKEPRQKMINLMYLVLTALLALNVSAEVIEAFKTVDKSLITSNNNIEASNTTLFKSLEGKLVDEKTKAKAEIWKPKADQARKLSEDLNNYLENLKKDLKASSGLKKDANGNVILNEHGEEDYKLDDLNASSRLMDNEKKGKELDDKLRAYREAMLNIDPAIRKQFESNFPVEVTADGKDNTTSSFRMMPTVAAITLLSKYQNNVKNAENQVVAYAHNQIDVVALRFDKTGVLLGQSANYVMPGDEITITAGIGAYSSAAAPQITIGGSSVPVVDGQGTYKVSAGGGGSHTVPVTIRYKDQDGNEKTETKSVEYTVGTPGGAAVMLDKMNVFYIGVDNPVTIGSPTGWDKTKVSMTGGTISSGTSARTVRVTALGSASITVNADGKSSTFNYRIKKIPDPSFKVGSGKARVPAVEFKNQQFCRADLGDEFLFDLKFNVVSATVYFSGANFPNVTTGTITGNSLAGISALMARCGPGSSITFVNIKVQGPDGVRSIDERAITLY